MGVTLRDLRIGQVVRYRNHKGLREGRIEGYGRWPLGSRIGDQHIVFVERPGRPDLPYQVWLDEIVEVVSPYFSEA